MLSIGLGFFISIQEASCAAASSLSNAPCFFPTNGETFLLLVLSPLGPVLFILGFLGVFNAAAETWTRPARLPLTVASILMMFPIAGVIGAVALVVGMALVCRQLRTARGFPRSVPRPS